VRAAGEAAVESARGSLLALVGTLVSDLFARSSCPACWSAVCAGSGSPRLAFPVRYCSARWRASEFIPLVGPLLLAVVASIVGALHTPMLALRVVGFLGVLRLVEDYVIYPRLIHRGIHIPWR
jgi:hypothetical protein